VFRCAGSRPVDLVAIKDGQILLVECKAGLNPFLSPQQRHQILAISQQIDATPVLAVRKRYRGIRWFIIAEERLKEAELTSVIQA
jgi:Holliday junction resolvase